MKLITILLFAAILQLSAKTSGQSITLSLKDAPLEKVFKEIQKQSGYAFVYFNDDLVNTRKIDIEVKAANLEDVLSACLNGQSLSFSITDKTVVIKKSTLNEAEGHSLLKGAPPVDIHGRIVNESGEPVEGVTVMVKGTRRVTATDANGEFTLAGINENATLVFTATNIESFETKVGGKTELSLTAKAKVSNLQEVVVNKGYYSTTQRLNTGNVGVMKGDDITMQPVGDPLMALEGRIPGLLVTQNSGVPGSSLNVQIRGKNSLVQGSSPLFIVDGVPFSANNGLANQVGSAAGKGIGASQPGGLSPFGSINPADIESIEVLKDADALAIYGSRGANGVVLITTKKGKPGALHFSASVQSGSSVITRFLPMPMMNTGQYVMMRKEAFKNDNIIATAANAPDLLVWDTTRYTDLKKLLVGGTAHTMDAEVSLSGGNVNTTFLLGAGYHHQTTVYPGDMADNRASVHLNVNQVSTDKKFAANLSAIYSSEKNNLITTDLTNYFSLPPDLPPLYDSLGNLNWVQKGVAFGNNPLSILKMPYTAQTDNLLSNLSLSYHLLRGLSIKTSFGYNAYYVNETALSPIAAQNPAISPTGSATFANSQLKSWIIEPQVDYTTPVLKGKLNILIGATFQEQSSYQTRIDASGYTSDNLLQSVAGAATVRAANGNSQYHYQAFFGRINYVLENKYILNLTGRRDGSSRFGPDRQFGNFASAGAAWIFSDEQFIKKHVSFLSFGKLRGSYGTTGNDQIGEYQFLDSYTNTPLPYNATPALLPARLFNGDYSWEVNKKLELAADLGFLKDRILLSPSWFRNRSSNQLVNYTLPTQTGASSILKNFPAIVENTGWEFLLTTKNFVSKKFNWTSSFNISIPRNKLVSFPGLATSSYNGRFFEGQSLSVVTAVHLLGVDPATGLFIFATKTGSTNSPGSQDFGIVGDLAPKYYGGLQNSFSYKGWQLDFFLEFKKQLGVNYKSVISTNIPGMQVNQPAAFLNRWQKPGDISEIQQYTTTYGPAGITALSYYGRSDVVYSDASYIRLKNVSLSYNFPTAFLKKAKLQNMRLFLLGQNLLTITRYLGNDPETMNFYSMPPLKTITAGIQFTF